MAINLCFAPFPQLLATATTQALYSNFNAQIEGSDYLGDAAKYIKLWNKLQAELSTGTCLNQNSSGRGRCASSAGSHTCLKQAASC